MEQNHHAKVSSVTLLQGQFNRGDTVHPLSLAERR
jgi:hypothetical protein